MVEGKDLVASIISFPKFWCDVYEKGKKFKSASC